LDIDNSTSWVCVNMIQSIQPLLPQPDFIASETDKKSWAAKFFFPILS
jgi:hypothetical protein